ncbi:MAG: T9SS type A sorting domain-containing protein [Lewinellaceae bacterium]|nr:T9SS type A sorting domain-containing protein [Lewinellaceae bacterium]
MNLLTLMASKRYGKGRLIKVEICAFLFLAFGFSFLQAQEATLTTGRDAFGEGGAVSYSVGQIVYTSNIGINGSAILGVQQPFEISIVTSLVGVKPFFPACKVYPNPTVDFLILSIENHSLENLSYQLFDINGKLLLGEVLSQPYTNIPTNNLVAATYFLKVLENSKQLVIFKIIKN